jgi:hypothetical protein
VGIRKAKRLDVATAVVKKNAMNRRSFFATIAAGIAVPAIGATLGRKSAVDAARASTEGRTVRTRPGLRYVATIPPEAGKVMSTAMFHDHIFVCCEHGLWTMPISELPKPE